MWLSEKFTNAKKALRLSGFSQTVAGKEAYLASLSARI